VVRDESFAVIILVIEVRSFYTCDISTRNGFPVVFRTSVDEDDFAIFESSRPLEFVQGFEHHLYNMLSFRNKPLFLRFEVNIKAVLPPASRTFFRLREYNPALQTNHFLDQLAHFNTLIAFFLKIVKKI